jgi:uncharacterized delta-60 repeat protein
VFFQPSLVSCNRFVGVARLCRLSMLGLAWVALLVSADVFAIDGEFDPSFGSQGRATFSLSSLKYDLASAVRQTSDGKLIVTGTCGQVACIVRLRTDGTLDPNYGPLGLGYLKFDQLTGVPSAVVLYDVVVLSDGRAAVVSCAGGPSGAVFIVRADGTALDTSVGNGTGYFIGTQGSSTLATCPTKIARQSDGKFVVAQNEHIAGVGDVMSAARVAADLSGLDPSFGTGGATEVAFGVGTPGSAYDHVYALAIDGGGNIILGGTGIRAGSDFVMEFARLLPSGQRDSSFGTNGDGRVYYDITSLAGTQISALTIDAGQRIVFGGQYSLSGTAYQMVGRLTTAGLFDTTFQPPGFVTYSFDSGAQFVADIAATADSIIALGQVPRSTSSGNHYFQVTRLDTHGQPVSAFGITGSSHSSFAADDTSDLVSAQLLTSKGIVIAGASIDTGVYTFGVARVQYEHLFGDSFE